MGLLHVNTCSIRSKCIEILYGCKKTNEHKSLKKGGYFRSEKLVSKLMVKLKLFMLSTILVHIQHIECSI